MQSKITRLLEAKTVEFLNRNPEIFTKNIFDDNNSHTILLRMLEPQINPISE